MELEEEIAYPTSGIYSFVGADDSDVDLAEDAPQDCPVGGNVTTGPSQESTAPCMQRTVFDLISARAINEPLPASQDSVADAELIEACKQVEATPHPCISWPPTPA